MRRSNAAGHVENTESTPVDNLLRGVSTHHTQTIRDAWRELLEQGAESVVAVRSKLATSAWVDPPVGPVSGYLAALLAVLDELDPDAFAEELTRLLDSALHPTHRKTVLFLSKRRQEEPIAFIEERVPVYVSTEIADRARIAGNITKWSRTPGVSLVGVTRIGVIARSNLDYLGQYGIRTSEIVLTWPARRVRGLRRWYQTLNAEFTFYHEVGHHVRGHLEGGQVEEQEKEADDYAAALMQQRHPVLVTLLKRIIRPVVRWTLKSFIRKAR